MLFSSFRFLRPPLLSAILGRMLSGCVSNVLKAAAKAVRPIPAKLASAMHTKGMSPSSPILVRIFEWESELEIWKHERNGHFALLKNYPVCRWSGPGPRTRAGDRQAPEGYYDVDTGTLNPNSRYYLSSNLCYPNRPEEALDYSGKALTAHGTCFSARCYALTEDDVAEIYALAREALKSSQRSFQVQAYPFRMTQENTVRNRPDANYAFWPNLKQDYDSFEATRRQLKVGYCERQYTFDVEATQGAADPRAACPPLAGPADSLVAARARKDRIALERLSTTASTVYFFSSGGMRESFDVDLKREGEKTLAKRMSLISVLISRPAAALADPYDGHE